MWHVAPSGTLEPSPQDPVLALVERELAEELGITLGNATDVRSRLVTLGVGFDLLRLRPEICLRLDLESHEYPPGGPVLTPDEFQQRALIPLSAEGIEAFWKAHTPEMLTPAAAATVALLENAAQLP
jgi:8-oxo-dGTP pyrophosphatase MutT (NUDIX family)